MYSIQYRPDVCNLTIILILMTVYGGVVYFVSLYFYYSTLAIIIIIAFTLILLIRAVGLFAIYPGSYRYVTAQLEKNQNDNLLNNIRRDLQNVQKISNKIINWDLGTFKSFYYKISGPYTMACLKTQCRVLQKSQNTQQKKFELIKHYEQLIQILEKPIQQQIGMDQSPFISMEILIRNPQTALSLNSQNSYGQLKKVAQRSRVLCRQIWHLCIQLSKIKESQSFQQQYTKNKAEKTMVLDANKFQIANWHFYTPKLFTMDSFYGYWDDVFVYQKFLVSVQNGYCIEAAIIHGQKDTKNEKDKQEQTNKNINRNINSAVLICNPNGAFFQSFALSSTYFNFYLKWGLKIVVWNYRGYAKSSGISSVPKCIQDVFYVYSYVVDKYKINVQVLHGYSIGGIPAINLAARLNKNEQNRPIKLLIADRTFSSLDKVAEGFIRGQNLFAKLLKRIASPFVKFFFMSDCSDNSIKFFETQCNKVLIFDTRDQIISSSASLKYGLLRIAVKDNRTNEQESSSESQRLVEQSQIRTSLKNETENFVKSICKLYNKNLKIFETVIKVMEDIYGGGEKIYFNAQRISSKYSISKIKDSLFYYFISLVVYGPKSRLSFNISQSQFQADLKRLFQQKISKFDQILQNLSNEQKDDCSKYLIKIRNALQYAKSQMNISQLIKNEKKFGKLIVSEVGHNNDIKREYYFLQRILNEAITKKEQQAASNQEIPNNI